MKWCKTLNEFEYGYFTYIKNFVLIKETEKAVYLKLDNNLNIWFPKSCIRNYNGQSAYVLSKIYINNIYKERQKQLMKLIKLKFPHNGAIAKEFTVAEIQELEKELDDKMEQTL